MKPLKQEIALLQNLHPTEIGWILCLIVSLYQTKNTSFYKLEDERKSISVVMNRKPQMTQLMHLDELDPR